MLDPAEARMLLDSIDVSTHAGLRDRALIGLMVYSFARIGAALGMTVEDVYTHRKMREVGAAAVSRARGRRGKRRHTPRVKAKQRSGTSPIRSRLARPLVRSPQFTLN